MTRLHAPPRPLAAAIALAAIPLASPARADMIDYSALESLFGEPVTTSATGQPQRVSEAPANMLIITADDIRRSGATDIPGVLRHVGGLDVAEWTAGHTDISIRGYNEGLASRLLVLIDGRQVYAEQFGFTPWHALPVELSEIQQIEVVKGPNTALYGFNAVGGVINIITVDPAHGEVREASATAGTQDATAASLVNTFSLGDLGGVRVSLGASRSDEYDTPAPPNILDVRPRDRDRLSAAVDGSFMLGEKANLRLTATYADASRNDMSTGAALLGVNYIIRSQLGRLSADTPLGLLRATIYTNDIHYQADAASLPAFVFDNELTIAQVEDVISVGNAHTLRGAIEYRTSSINTVPFNGGEITYDVYSAAGMWDWKITPALSLTNAVRLDELELERTGAAPAGYPFPNTAWDRTISETSFNTGLVWRASQRDTVRLLASRGVQLPNLVNLGALLVDTPPFSVTGDPTLKSSVTDNIEIDWAHTVNAIDGALRVSLFHQTNADMVGLYDAFILANTGAFIAPANIGDSETIGVEIGLNGAFGDGWRWSVDHRAQTIDDDFATAFGLPSAWANYEDTTAEHLTNAHLGWSGGRWEADGYLRHQSNTNGLVQAPPLGVALAPVEAYVAFDGRVGYALTDNVTLAISGKNLGESQQRQASAPDVERQVMGTLSVRY